MTGDVDPDAIPGSTAGRERWPRGDLDGDFNLDAFLPYLLNQAAEAAGRGFARTYRSEHGMTRTQWRVLANLGRFGAMTATEICRISHMEKTKVSRAITAMEARGWVCREASRQDRRVEILNLTLGGRELFRTLGVRANDYDRKLRERLGPERSEAVSAILRDLIAFGSNDRDGDEVT